MWHAVITEKDSGRQVAVYTFTTKREAAEARRDLERQRQENGERVHVSLRHDSPAWR